MADSTLKINAFIDKLYRMLRLDPLSALQATKEARKYLEAEYKKETSRGCASDEAEKKAISNFLKTDFLARHYSKVTLLYRFFLQVGAAASIITSIFLILVIVFILPERDPTQIPLWSAVMMFFMLYGVLTYAYLRDQLVPWLRLTLWIFSATALAVGTYAFIREAIDAYRLVHFEGHIIIMSLLLIGHSKILLLDLWKTRKK